MWHSSSAQRVSAAEAGVAPPAASPTSWDDVKRRSRSQLALVSCVVLVLMAGAATTLHDKLRGDPADFDKQDVGAPAVTGKRAS